MTLRETHCDGALWEPDNKAANPSGNMCRVPITAGNSDSVRQRLQIILHPSLPTIFPHLKSYYAIRVFFLSFFYPNAPDKISSLKASLGSLFIQRGDSHLKGRVKANEACGPQGENIMLFDLFNYWNSHL